MMRTPREAGVINAALLLLLLLLAPPPLVDVFGSSTAIAAGLRNCPGASPLPPKLRRKVPSLVLCTCMR